MRIPHVWLIGALLLLLAAALAGPARAQSDTPLTQPPTHRNVMADIALQCVLAHIDKAAPLQVEGKGLAPIVAPGLEAGC